MLKTLYNHYNPLAVPVAKAPHSLTITLPNDRAKRRGGKASPRSQNVTPRPLERTVAMKVQASRHENTPAA